MAVSGGTRGLRKCWEDLGGDGMHVGGILTLLTLTGPGIVRRPVEHWLASSGMIDRVGLLPGRNGSTFVYL